MDITLAPAAAHCPLDCNARIRGLLFWPPKLRSTLTYIKGLSKETSALTMQRITRTTLHPNVHCTTDSISKYYVLIGTLQVALLWP
jgi:hypothetical protein